MKKICLLLFVSVLLVDGVEASTAAQARAARLQKGMSLAVWLESSYWFFNTTTFPNAARYTEADIKNLHDLCFQTVRLPVFFEPFAGYTPPYTFNMANQNVVRGLNYVDSVIAWTGKYGMNLVIDNHLADDDNTNGLQTHYQITDANYTTQTALLCAVWRQVIYRYGYADPNRVLFELRNEPNTVSDAHLHILYQTLIDTVRLYDHAHTLIVGNTGYYDALLLSGSTPYTDTNLIYTFHIYDGNNYPGFCFQGQGGVPATDSVAGTHVSFNRHGVQGADITTEVQAVSTWATTHQKPVWLGEFGCTTLSQIYHDDTSRCNYIANFGTILDHTAIPWCYWDGYGPDEFVTSYDGGITLTYLFSIFDRSNMLTAAHLHPCFKSALHLGSLCNVSTGEVDINIAQEIVAYPNPATESITLSIPNNNDTYTATLIDITGKEVSKLWEFKGRDSTIDISSFAKGLYLLKLINSKGQAVVKKIVVQ